MIVNLVMGNANIRMNEENDNANMSVNRESDSTKDMMQEIKKIFEPWKDKVLETRDALFEYFKKNNYFKTGEKGLFNYACVMTVSTLLRLKKKTLVMGALGFFGYEVHEDLSQEDKKKLKEIPQNISIILKNLFSSK